MSKFTIQDIFIMYGDEYIKNYNLSKYEWKVFNAIRNCKTKNLGYHIYTCKDCGEEYFGYNLYRNRHCPMCQSYAREKWINNEYNYLLDTKYFHIVTTVPYELNEIFLYNKKICYNILFKATSESILTLSSDSKWLGAKVGITSILHTWGQTMEFHPHIHSIVTGGGLNNNLNNFKSFNKYLEPPYNKTWITYIEPPKRKTENVIEYIGRYSFRVVISNERIKNIENGFITFEYKDYKDNSKIKEITISALEFIRRFLKHVLPDNFTKIKHYGLLSNRNKKNNIRLCRLLISKIITNKFINSKSRILKKFECNKCGSSDFLYSFNYNINRLCVI
ncbi:MAG: transposase [Candidatus Aphodocola sp.]